MSLQNKLRNAAAAAATEAVQIERARCLWLLDNLLHAATFVVKNKIWSEAERHAASVKLDIVKAIVDQARRGIVSGMRPPTPLHVLRQPVNDVGEMQTRLSNLVDVLGRLGWEGDSTIEDVVDQIKEWGRQEDRIDELEAVLEKYEEHDHEVKEVLDEKTQSNTVD